MITVMTLKGTIQSGARTYPVYIGLLEAAKIADISTVPRFAEATSNNDIARNVSAKPVKEWQRPEIKEKVAAIRMLYDNTGKFMPNPILVGQNNSASSPPIATPYTIAGNSTPLWKIELDDDPFKLEKPLWILDGQHRIAGLSSSAQSSNQVPIVFLLNQGSTYYQPDTLAEVFAEVTTSATPLGTLHREWLSFAFDLNDYSKNEPDASHQHRSMEVVVELCKTPSFAGSANPYFDRLRFNDHSPQTKLIPGGYAYDCKELKQIVYESYFNAQIQASTLTPAELAREMCAARRALEAVTAGTQTSNSVFFGDDAHHQKIMEDAFWHGALSYLRFHGAPASWMDVLRTLKFDQTSWDFSWKVSLHGKDQSRSKSLAMRVMGNAFQTGVLPTGVNNIADYLRGSGAGIELVAYRKKASGGIDKKSLKELAVKKGDTQTFPVEDRDWIRVAKSGITANIAEVDVTDKKAPPGTLVKYNEILSKKGLNLDAARHKTPLELLVTIHHYGGVSSTADIDVLWIP